MTFLVEECSTSASFTIIRDGVLPSLIAQQGHSCIVGTSPCGVSSGLCRVPLRAGALVAVSDTLARGFAVFLAFASRVLRGQPSTNTGKLSPHYPAGMEG